MAEEHERPEEHELTGSDWGKIHAKAWRDSDFRKLLETDPTQAITNYIEDEEKKKGRKFNRTKLKMVKLRPRPHDIPDQFLEDVNPFPPSCC